MPRVIGIDPGTVTIDACGLEDGRMFLDRSVPTAEALADAEIVDGVGGSAGPMGFRGPGALDGEVAFLAGSVPKSLLFDGGAASVAGWDGDPGSPDALGNPRTARERIAREAFVEGAVK